jgi:hypothetical protein
MSKYFTNKNMDINQGVPGGVIAVNLPGGKAVGKLRVIVCQARTDVNWALHNLEPHLIVAAATTDGVILDGWRPGKALAGGCVYPRGKNSRDCSVTRMTLRS